MTSEKLTRVQAYAAIFSSVALPIIVAVFGWVVQVRLSEESHNKEYVD